MSGPFGYQVRRALEDAAFARAAVPLRVHRVALPVWPALVEADVLEAQEYELIDRFLAKGLAHAGLTSTAELAEFFALDENLVDRALRALHGIGHVEPRGPGWALTPIGEHSVRDGRRYVVGRDDRRELYFDGFGSRPLPRSCYAADKVAMYPIDQVPRGFQAFYTTASFDVRALAALASHPHRERFNLPERVDRPRLAGGPPCLAFLPLYVVVAAGPRYLVYTPASSEVDADMSDLVSATAEVTQVLASDDGAARPAAEVARAWLDDRGFGDVDPEERSSGALRVTLPARAFRDDALELWRLGSFEVRGTAFFQLWCDDEGLRAKALLNHVDRSSSRRAGQERLPDLLDRAREQYELDLGVGDLCAAAREMGRSVLAARLAELSARP